MLEALPLNVHKIDNNYFATSNQIRRFCGLIFSIQIFQITYIIVFLKGL